MMSKQGGTFTITEKAYKFYTSQENVLHCQKYGTIHLAALSINRFEARSEYNVRE